MFAVVLNVERVGISAGLQTIDEFGGAEQENITVIGKGADACMVERGRRHFHRVRVGAEFFDQSGHAVGSVEVVALIENHGAVVDHRADVADNAVKQSDFCGPLQVGHLHINEADEAIGSENLFLLVFGDAHGNIQRTFCGVELFGDLVVVVADEVASDLFCLLIAVLPVIVHASEVRGPVANNGVHDFVVDVFLAATEIDVIAEEFADGVLFGVEHRAVVAEFQDCHNLVEKRRTCGRGESGDRAERGFDFVVRASGGKLVLTVPEVVEGLVKNTSCLGKSNCHLCSPFGYFLCDRV